MIIILIVLILFGCPLVSYARWDYMDNHDPMRNQNSRHAFTKSVNWINFNFPYTGGSSAILCLTNSTIHGKNVHIEVDKGQFYCIGMNGCSVSVKFDNDKIQKFRAVRASDGSTNIIFIKPYDQFISRLRKSKKVFIEAEFFREGLHQMEFETGDLQWK